MLRRYFEDEMRALQEAGREFATAFPEQARHLHPESLTDRDPHVERLFEGFALLVGRVRQRLDDELPEYSEGLCRLLYPHYLRPIPALTILEFTPKQGLLQQTETVPHGFEARSAPVGDEKTVCRFTTTRPLRLHPIRLTDARVAWPTPATSVLTLRLEAERGIEWAQLDLEPLELYFGMDPAVATPLRLFLARHVAGVTVRAGDIVHELGAAAVDLPAAVDDGVLPYSPATFPGFRLLQEYFSFRQRFAFARLSGLGGATSAATGPLEINIRFSKPLPHEVPITTREVRLFCVPAINLFDDSGEPIKAEHRQSDYAVRADGRRASTVEVFEITGVEGIEENGQRHPYAPFHSFAWPTGRFYEEITRAGPDGRRQTFVAVGGESEGGALVLSLAIKCINGDLPHDALPEGTLSKAAPGTSNVATFRNVGRPTRALRPPLDTGEGFLWRLLAYLAMNRSSIATPASLGALLSLHDWSGDPANARRVQSIRGVSWRPSEALHRGGIVRGSEVTVEVEDAAWVDDGDLHLFGTVLSAVLADYATINSFVYLELIARPSGRHFRWTPRTGTQPLL